MRGFVTTVATLGAAVFVVVGTPSAASAGLTGSGAPSGPMCEGKQEWPELVGTEANKAQRTIEEENPNVSAVIVPPDTMGTTDYRCDRVRVHTTGKSDTTVARTPRVG